jgi:5-methyltetrahydropteroyltriglutamate--homocysteine methyltransferase
VSARIKTTVVGSYPLPDWLAAAPSEQALEDAMRGFEAHVEPLPGVDFGVDVDPTHHRSGSSEAR